MGTMTTAAFLLVITLASIVIVTISTSFPRCISCPCGSGNQNYSHCIDDSELKNFTCDRWSNCQTCKANTTVCITCPSQRFGPTCSEIKSQIAACDDPGIPKEGRRLNPDGSDASYQRTFEEGESLVFTCKNESFALTGKSFITCLADGTWSEPRPTCITSRIVPSPRATCDDPGVPWEGSRLNPDGSSSSYPHMFEIGESVIFTCNGENSALEGSSYITCLANGTWSDSRPRCINSQVVEVQRAVCADPGIPVDGSRLNPDGSNAFYPRAFEEGESVIFTCSGKNFALHGASFITCLVNGTWSAPRPLCINPEVEAPLVDAKKTTTIREPQFCLFPKVDPNSEVMEFLLDQRTDTQNFEQGSELNFRCKAGFVLEGPIKIICNSNGEWSPPSPKCNAELNSTFSKDIVTSCRDPGFVDSGKRSDASSNNSLTFSSYFVGQSVAYSCQEGYELRGNSTLTCLPSGQWSSGKPACNEIPVMNNTIMDVTPSCPNPGYISKGSRPSYPVGKSIVYSCAEGYQIRGNKTITCLSTGQWSSDTPWCYKKEITLAMPTTTEASEVREPQFCLFPQMDPNSEVMEFLLDQRTDTQNFEQGTELNFRCKVGFVLEGPIKIICNSNGEWSPPSPKCNAELNSTFSESIVTSCRDPGYIDGGNRSDANGNDSLPSSGYFIGQSVAYSCQEGYKLRGNSTLTCLPSGQWSSGKPECNEIPVMNNTIMDVTPSCPNPGYITKGSRPSYPVGKPIVYSCAEGYQIRGNKTITCLSTGQWSSKIPWCYKKEVSLAVPTTTNSNSVDETQSCPFPKVNLNSEVREFLPDQWNPNQRFEPGTELNFRCKEGYTLEGSNKILCNSSGQWSTQSPKCRIKLYSSSRSHSRRRCLNPGHLTNGRVDVIPPFDDPIQPSAFDFPYRTRLNYSCSEGFFLLGDDVLSCESQGYWSGFIPLCDKD